MAEYHITTMSGALNETRKFSMRQRADAAWLCFNRHVDAMVRSQARLDTRAGAEAMQSARYCTAPAKGESFKIELCGDTVLFERVA